MQLIDAYDFDTQLSGKQIAATGTCGDFDDSGGTYSNTVNRTKTRTEQD